MADNFLEKHHEDYEKRKAQWMAKKNRTHLIYTGTQSKTKTQ